MRSISRLIVAAILLAGFSSAQINRDAGAFYYKEYLPEIYGAHPQNWAAVQDSRGFMYFGNTDGVLEYSGVSWRTIPLSNGEVARSLAVDEHGVIYVGGSGEIGFLKPDATGTLQYTSLVDRIPINDRRFSDVWNVYPTQAGVLFGSQQRIFRWGPDGMKVWRPSSTAKFGFLSVVNGTAYVKDGDLCRIAGNSVEPVPGGGKFHGINEIQSVFSFAGSLTVATSDALYRSDGKDFTRWVTPVDNRLRDSRIYRVLPLRDGDLAIGTLSGGLVLMTPDGQLDRVIDTKSGAASNTVNGIYADRAGSLWLMFNKGILHVEIELPTTHFADRQGLEEIVLAIQRHQGSLYAGTMTGLSRMVLPPPGGTPHFDPVPGIQGQIFTLLSTSQGLLAGGQLGIYEVSDRGSRSILPGVLIWDLCLSMYDSKVLYAASSKGLYVFHLQNGQWKNVAEVPSEGHAFKSVQEDSDGRVWVTTGAGITRIYLTSSGFVTERFTEKDGVRGPFRKNVVYRIGNRVVFATPKGLLQFDRERKRFVPCESFGSMFADGTHPVSSIRQSPRGDVWISGEGYNGILHNYSKGTYNWELNPLARSGIKELYALYLDGPDVAWAAGSEGGMVRHNVWATSLPVDSFAARIQTVQYDRGGQTIFGGAGALASRPRVQHGQNALRFAFAAPEFEDESRTVYQVRLDKLDHGWSEWSPDARREYMNLWEGSYVFHVRARDLYGRISEEATFAFDVLPPWYRTWWAGILYGIALLGGISALVKWRLHKLAEANQKLESIIEERTEEIRNQRDEIQKQRDTIKEDEEKTRALLLNILPASVAEELSATGGVAPVGYDDITVCFTDFVGFTLSSEGLPAADLVAALHRYFTAFDEIVGRYGLEKLKTIGDSYMFVSGLPNRSCSHAVDAVLAALEIADYVVSMGQTRPGWRIRIGIHSGPVVAGVVGVRKFAFDIWGETVNFASRFESSGAPNRVNISAQTYELVRDFIDCEPRGPIWIKEKRQLDMYFARGIRPELMDPDADGASTSFAKLYKKKFGRLPLAMPYERSPRFAVPVAGGN
jgi:class 3 adenylate cyclase